MCVRKDQSTAKHSVIRLHLLQGLAAKHFLTFKFMSEGMVPSAVSVGRVHQVERGGAALMEGGAPPLGRELNSEVEHQTARDSTTGRQVHRGLKSGAKLTQAATSSRNERQWAHGF